MSLPVFQSREGHSGSESGSDVLTDECDFTLEPLAAILTFEKGPTAMQRSRNTASVIIKCFTAWLELVAFPATDFCDALCGFSVHGALFGVSVAGLRMFSEMIGMSRKVSRVT